MSSILNDKNFDPYMKLKILDSYKSVSFIDLIERHCSFSEKQNFPSDILLKFLGDDMPLDEKLAQKLSSDYDSLLTMPIYPNFRNRFMKADLKKSDPKQYKQIVNLFQKCLDNPEMKRSGSDLFERNCVLAKNEYNINYMKMISELNINDKEMFVHNKFQDILRDMAEKVSPTPRDYMLDNPFGWNAPNPEKDRARITRAYLNQEKF